MTDFLDRLGEMAGRVQEAGDARMRLSDAVTPEFLAAYDKETEAIDALVSALSPDVVLRLVRVAKAAKAVLDHGDLDILAPRVERDPRKEALSAALSAVEGA